MDVINRQMWIRFALIICVNYTSKLITTDLLFFSYLNYMSLSLSILGEIIIYSIVFIGNWINIPKFLVYILDYFAWYLLLKLAYAPAVVNGDVGLAQLDADRHLRRNLSHSILLAQIVARHQSLQLLRCIITVNDYVWIAEVLKYSCLEEKWGIEDDQGPLLDHLESEEFLYDFAENPRMRDFVQHTSLFWWLKDDLTQPRSIYLALFSENFWTKSSSKCRLIPRIVVKLWYHTHKIINQWFAYIFWDLISVDDVEAGLGK